MTEVPRIVQERLRAAGPVRAGKPHPEANLLTAFAEQALLPAERELVLSHLALCSNCRDVVALAFPAFEPAAAPSEVATTGAGVTLKSQIGDDAGMVLASARPKLFAWANLRLPSLRWANLRWAALAAGVLVAVLLVRTGLDHRQTQGPTASVASPTPESSASMPQAPSKALQERASIVGADENQKNSSTPAMSAAAKPVTTLKEKPTPLIASNRQQSAAGVTTQSSAVVESASDASRVANEEVAASSKVAKGEPELSDSRLMATNVAADKQPVNITRAKPPIEAMATNQPAKDAVSPQASTGTSQLVAPASGSVVEAAPIALAKASTMQPGNWMVSAGVLKHSTDGGQSWQTSLQAPHPLLCYGMHGHEIWTGGQGGTLERSDDGGTTWNMVAVSDQGQPLNADVTRIEMQAIPSVVLSTANGETWTSPDDGKTWARK